MNGKTNRQASTLSEKPSRRSKPVESEERLVVYIPPFSLKKIRVRRANADNGGETVGMSLRTFEKRIAPALGNSFSGDAYFDQYIDIREAAKLGKIASPLKHCGASLRAVRICRMAGA